MRWTKPIRKLFLIEAVAATINKRSCLPVDNLLPLKSELSSPHSIGKVDGWKYQVIMDWDTYSKASEIVDMQ